MHSFLQKKGPVSTCLSIEYHTVQSAVQNDVSTTLYGFSGAQNLILCSFTNPSRWTAGGTQQCRINGMHSRQNLTLQLLVDCSGHMRLSNFVRTRQIPSQDGVP